jgi:hypothetical protein
MAIGGIIKQVISPITDLVSEVIVDKDKRDEINLKIAELADKADERLHKELMAQAEINKVEAGHASIFVAGWRPFIGWTGGIGLAYSFVLAPFIEFIARATGYTGEMPVPDASQLMALVTAMLGIGAMRSFDKMKHTAPLPKGVK